MLPEDHLELSYWDHQDLVDQPKQNLLLIDMVLFTYALDHSWRMKSTETHL